VAGGLFTLSSQREEGVRDGRRATKAEGSSPQRPAMGQEPKAERAARPRKPPRCEADGWKRWMDGEAAKTVWRRWSGEYGLEKMVRRRGSGEEGLQKMSGEESLENRVWRRGSWRTRSGERGLEKRVWSRGSGAEGLEKRVWRKWPGEEGLSGEKGLENRSGEEELVLLRNNYNQLKELFMPSNPYSNSNNSFITCVCLCQSVCLLRVSVCLFLCLFPLSPFPSHSF